MSQAGTQARAVGGSAGATTQVEEADAAAQAPMITAPTRSAADSVDAAASTADA